MKDFSFLKGHVGENVKVIEKNDPRYNDRFKEHIYQGVLGEGYRTVVEIFSGTAVLSIPYLGSTGTVWNIRKDDGTLLFGHKKLHNGIYEIVGPDRLSLGRVNVDVPYHTPYGDIEAVFLNCKYTSLVSFGTRDKIREQAKEAHKEWKKNNLDHPVPKKQE